MKDEELIRRQRTGTLLRVALAAGIVVCALGWLALLEEIKTIIVSGPLLLIAGIACWRRGLRLRHRAAIWVGVAHVGMVLFTTALINVMEWGPTQAEMPVTLLASAYVAATIWASIRAYQHIPQANPFGMCQNCGYLLWGLVEPRCPECGTPFNPAWLERLRQPPE